MEVVSIDYLKKVIDYFFENFFKSTDNEQEIESALYN